MQCDDPDEPEVAFDVLDAQALLRPELASGDRKDAQSLGRPDRSRLEQVVVGRGGKEREHLRRTLRVCAPAVRILVHDTHPLAFGRERKLLDALEPLREHVALRRRAPSRP